MYHSVLVPVDGSAGSELAVEHAAGLAARYDATLHFVYVVDSDVVNHYAGIDAIEGVEAALTGQGRDALDAAAVEAERAGCAAEEHVVEGRPYEAILDAATDVKADLIVMGTEQKSSEYRRLIGSVTDRVVRLATVPVHVVKASA